MKTVIKEKTAVIYSRVSTFDQETARQVEELRVYAKYKGYKVLEVFEEKISGAIKGSDRFQFNRMMKFIIEKKPTTLLVWELPRIGRSFFDIIDNVRIIGEQNVNIYFKKENINTIGEDGQPDPVGNIIISVLSGIAEIERKTTMARTKSGLAYSIKNGGAGTGKIKAFGYKSVNKKLVVDEDEAKVVKEIYKKYLSGLGCQQIAGWLNGQNIPTKFNKLFNKDIMNKSGGKRHAKDFIWRDGTVYGILTNTIYHGKRNYNNEVYEAPAIVSAETFKLVQRTLNERHNLQDINRKYKNYLKNILKCGCCGRNYFLHKRHNNNDNAYKCISKRLYEYCGNPSISIDKLLSALYIASKPLIKDEGIKQKIQSKNSILQQLEKKEIIKSNLINELEKLGAKKSRLIKMNINGTIDEKQFLVENKIIVSDISNSEKKLDIVNKELENLYAVNKLSNKDILQYTPDVFKEYVTDYLEFVRVFEVINRDKYFKYFPNKQDVLVLIELKPRLQNKEPIYFIMSQRSEQLLFVRLNNPKKDSKKQIDKGEYSEGLTGAKNNLIVQLKNKIVLTASAA